MPLNSAAYRVLFHALAQGFCVFQMLLDDGKSPVDYRFVEVNPAFERLTGLQGAVGKTARELVPDLEAKWLAIFGGVVLRGEASHFVEYSKALGRWFDIHAARIGSPEQRLVAVLFSDITDVRREQEEHERVEDALRVREQRFRAFADIAPAILWVTEADGRCSYLSRGWFEFTGQTEASGLGFGWLDAVHPGDRERAAQRFAAATHDHQAFELEHRVRRADGLYRWVMAAGRPRITADGTFEGFVGSVIDIHDRKVAEDRLDLALSSGRVGLWYCDLPFETLVWGPEVKEHFGLPPDATVTIDTFFERLHPEDREPTRTAIESAIAQQTAYDTRYRTVGLDGRIRWIRAIGRAGYDDGRPVSFDGITVDVTELVTLREEAEAANRAKDEFLAMLGHELRNPLAPILTALQLLKLRRIDAAERERAIIERQVMHVVGLVDDLLDVSRITRGRVELRTELLDLADVVARALETASPLLEQQRHYLDLDVPRGLRVEGDSGRLAQVIANLLTNAAKYTEPGGRISVTARADAANVELTVRDTGIGIDAAMLSRIFDLFVQERQTLARSQGGLGLGLAIVRSLTELHGGTVSASSAGRGHGTAMTIRLPRAAGADDAVTADISPSQTAPDGTGSGTRVLVVDDNEDAASLLGTLLEEFGYATHVVHDGPAALSAAEQFGPQLALVDIGLPVMDGFEVAQRFAEHPRLRTTKLIAVTGYGQHRDRERSARAGFAAHLVKPVDADQLRAVITAVIGQDDNPA